MILRPISPICGAFILVFSGKLHAQITAEQAVENAHRKFSVASCRESANTDEIVVCAPDNTRYSSQVAPHLAAKFEHERVEIKQLASDAGLPRECGVFQGQRRCGLRELRTHGYGGGSVPIRVLVKLVKKAVVPDYELGPPGGYPMSADENE